MQEYIKKSLETEIGINAECWSVTGIWIDLKANCAVINLEGYINIVTKNEGKSFITKKEVRIDNLDILTIFQSVHDAVVSLITSSEDFKNATLEIVE